MDTENVTGKGRKKKKRRKKHYLLRLIALFLIIAGLYYLLTSSLFTIYSVQVDGNQRYSDSEIADMAGVKIGNNLFKTHAHDIKKALMKNPYFESVRVSRKLPHTLVINIDEKNALLAVAVDGGYAILDDNSTVLEIVQDAKGSTILQGITLKTCEVGKKAEPTQKKLFSDACDIVRAMDKSGLFFTKIELSATADRLYIYDSLYFKGETKDLIGNMDSIKTMLYDLNQKGISRGVMTIGSDGYVSFSPLEG